jgi:hypothetical protein
MNTTDLKNKMVEYINSTTHRENLIEKSTKQVAEHFGIDTKTAYKLLVSISSKCAKGKRLGTNQITHLDPVNGQNFECCGWIRNEDN